MRSSALAALVLAGASIASAQTAEASLSFGQSIVRDNALGADLPGASSFYKVKDGFRVSARFTVNTKRYLGHEFGYGYARTKIEYPDNQGTVGMPTHQGYYNVLLYAIPEGRSIRPFLAGGAHFSTYYPPGASAYYGGGQTKFGLNYGAGVKVKVSPMFHVRFDVRDYSNPKPFDLAAKKGWLHQIEASAGLGIQF
jgi:opacity protein-like surface antigen